MSSLPPPSSPNPPPAGAPGPPPWQTSPGAPGGFAPAGLVSGEAATGSSPQKSKKPLIAVLVVLAAVIVIIVVATSGGDDSSSGSGSAIDASAAHDGLAAILDPIAFDNGAGELSGACPLGDTDEYVTKLPKSVERTSDFLDGLGGSNLAYEDADTTGVRCNAEPDDPSEVDSGLRSATFLALLSPPRDFVGYIQDQFGSEIDPTFEDEVEYRGGKLVAYCVESGDDHACAAAWYSTKQRIAVLISLLDDDATAAEASTTVKTLLPDVLDSLAERADDSEADTEVTGS